MTNKKLQEILRSDFLKQITDFYANKGEEVLTTASNEIAIPTLDQDGNEQWIVIKVSVPTGSRDGDAYDGYGVAEDYRLKMAEKAEKAAKAAEAKAKKIARDEKVRAEKKAQREAAKQK